MDRSFFPLMASATRRFLAAALLTGVLLPQVTWAKSPPPTLLQRIRELIGLNKAIPVAAGGSRGGDGLEVCVIAPRTNLDRNGHAQAVVPLPRPTILTAGSLNEVRIDRDGQRRWSQRASSTQAIEGPIVWPIEPIKAEERLILLLRPRGASGGDFAAVQLMGAEASEMAANAALLARLGQDPGAWLQAVDSALDRDQLELAWALLFASESPRSPELDDLRREVQKRGCGD